VAGDSYTKGSDVADEDTYPAALERVLGVGGYGPDQALLKLERLIDRFPHARVAVLTILTDDTSRMLNSFRPVLYRETGSLYGFKPYMRDGVLQPLIGDDPMRDFDAMHAAAETAFDIDFWRRPRAHFPYVFAVAQLFFLPSFQVVMRAQLQRRTPYEIVHRLEPARDNLRALFERFAAFTKSRGLAGIVAFIPPDETDQATGAIAISAASPAQREALAFVTVTMKSEYYPRPACHPSARGYAAIAHDVADVVRPLLDRTGPPRRNSADEEK
jgi:hypothetical protein